MSVFPPSVDLLSATRCPSGREREVHRERRIGLAYSPQLFAGSIEPDESSLSLAAPTRKRIESGSRSRESSDATAIDRDAFSERSRLTGNCQTLRIEALREQRPVASEQHVAGRDKYRRSIRVEQAASLCLVDLAEEYAAGFGDVIEEVTAIGQKLRESLPRLSVRLCSRQVGSRSCPRPTRA